MRSSLSVRLVIALAYATALIGALSRAVLAPAVVENSSRCSGSCEASTPPLDDPRWRRTLGLGPCWWTLGDEDLAQIRGLPETAARAVLAARDAGAAPFRASLERFGITARQARVIAATVVVRCAATSTSESPR